MLKRALTSLWITRIRDPLTQPVHLLSVDIVTKMFHSMKCWPKYEKRIKFLHSLVRWEKRKVVSIDSAVLPFKVIMPWIKKTGHRPHSVEDINIAKTNVCAATSPRKRIRGFLTREADSKLPNPVSGFEAFLSRRRLQDFLNQKADCGLLSLVGGFEASYPASRFEAS